MIFQPTITIDCVRIRADIHRVRNQLINLECLLRYAERHGIPALAVGPVPPQFIPADADTQERLQAERG